MKNEFFQDNIKKKQSVFIYDIWLLLVTFSLLVIGIVMVASTSMVISGQNYGTPFHFLWHEIIYVIISIVLAVSFLYIPINFWQRIGIYLLFLSFILLSLVLIPGIGKTINGSTRWLGLGGLRFEVSECVKFCVITYLAGYLTRQEEDIRNRIRGFIKPIILLAPICVLLLLEPDFGAAFVIIITALTMMFLSGARLWQFVLLTSLILAALAFLAFAAPYRLARLTSFLDPWARPFDVGYQLTQSLIAFGRGGVFGVGLGNSMQKLFYLPEAHTDFLFAVLAEEFGIMGGFVVLILFAILIGRTIYIGYWMQCIKNQFAAYLTFGFATYFFLQVMVNIGVNVGVLPTKGLTLPFISYGGSSMILNCVIIAVLLRVYHEAWVGKLSALKLYGQN